MCTSRGATADAERASAVTRRAAKALGNILKLKEGDSACGEMGRVYTFYTAKSLRRKGRLRKLKPSDHGTAESLR
jgi:hypothetical protein